MAVSSKKIVFSGGGSGGHVIPARTIIQDLLQQGGYEISYIGSISGIERKVISDIGVKYSPIRTGKLRRYLSVQNLLDIFNLIIGCFQSMLLLLKSRPKLIFLTGGFVIVPVAIAGWFLRIPMVLHEQTTRIGLANKLASYLVKKVLISFESSSQFLPLEKTVLTGYPVRDDLFQSVENRIHVAGINLLEVEKPILFITGGGNGSELLNEFVLNNLSALTKKYFIFHQTGLAHIEKYQELKSSTYIPLGFLGPEYIDILKTSSCVVSRAGAGTVAELLALKKPSIFIPLKIAQKNEQYHNAKEAEELLGSVIIEEDDFANEEYVLKTILDFNPVKAATQSEQSDAKEKIKSIIKNFLNN